MWFQESHRYIRAVNCKACMTSEKGLKTRLMFSVLHESKWLLTAWVIFSSWERVLLTDTFFYANHMMLLSELASKLFRAWLVSMTTCHSKNNLLFLCAETCRLWKFLLEIDRMLIWTWGVLRKIVLIEIIWNIKMIRTRQDFP